MKPEIKKRIEQIKKGVAPEGYKKTRVGFVPGEWELKKQKKALMQLLLTGIVRVNTREVS